MDNTKTLLSPHLPIIVGVSGGADSLCLLGMLHEAGYPLIVAHFDHKLRPESGEDAKYVESIAARFALPFVCENGDVVVYAKANSQTIEEAARNLRYRFLFAQARQHRAQAVAVGHTADDQVETVLMHFLRGAGLSGLKGMDARAILPSFDAEIPLVRPILDLWRADILAYCEVHDLHPHEDPSNASLDFFRNRLRHTLIPELENYNPRFREVLQRTSRALGGDHALLAEIIAKTWSQVVLEETENHISFDDPAIAKLSSALIRNLIRHAVDRLRPGQIDISFATLERAAQFISATDEAQRIDLTSGLLLFREADVLYLTSADEQLPLDAFPQVDVESIPIAFDSARSVARAEAVSSDVEISLDNSWVLTGTLSKTKEMLTIDDLFQVTLDADVLGENLNLRPRRDGDRFRPLGMDGQSMKLSDFLINVKLPRRAREHYPLLCVGDEIIWVPGYRPAHHVRVTESTRRVVVFRIKKSATHL